MEDRVNPDSSSTVITKDQPARKRDKRQLIPIWTFIREHRSSGEEEPDDVASALTRSRLYLVGLGIFVALVAGTLIFVSVRRISVLDNIGDLIATKKQLLAETRMMARQINALNVEIKKMCGPCPDHWIHYRQKCYLYYDGPAPWKTWEESQKFCQDRLGRLLIIGDVEEQKFISQNIKYYRSEQNGYWIGLQEVRSKWTWINGHVDTLGFWMTETVATPGSKALVVPRQNYSESWMKADNVFLNKFICNPADCIESATFSIQSRPATSHTEHAHGDSGEETLLLQEETCSRTRTRTRTRLSTVWRSEVTQRDAKETDELIIFDVHGNKKLGFIKKIVIQFSIYRCTS